MITTAKYLHSIDDVHDVRWARVAETVIGQKPEYFSNQNPLEPETLYHRVSNIVRLEFN